MDAIEEKKWDEMGEMLRANEASARKSGLVLISISPRRSVVVKISGVSDLGHFYGAIRFRGSRQACLDFIREETSPAKGGA